MKFRELILQEKKIVSSLTGVRLEEIVYNDLGWTSRIYVINQGEIVFKFPRTQKIIQEYMKEIQIYYLLNDINIGVGIPQVRWQDSELRYFGYAGIPGATLDICLNELTTDTKVKIGKILGLFLKKLHTLDLKDANTYNIKDEIAEFQEIFRRGENEIQTAFTKKKFLNIKNFVFQEFPEKVLKLGLSKALCHSDLGFWNIIYNPSGNIGIIDFGDVSYCDFSRDFIGLSDPTILESALITYGEDSKLREKIILRMKSLPILELPFFLEKKDRVGFKKTLKRIEDSF